MFNTISVSDSTHFSFAGKETLQVDSGGTGERDVWS
jgi:hypothetical protein